MEFVNVAEHDPIALKLPLTGNGICIVNVLPLFSPALLAYHWVDTLLRSNVYVVVPDRVAPEAGLNVKVADERSRGVE